MASGGTSRSLFFFAPEDKGYFILNEILRYVKAANHQQTIQDLAGGDTYATLLLEQGFPPLQEQPVREQAVSVPEVQITSRSPTVLADSSLAITHEEAQLNASIVGDIFIKLYYHIIHQSPELVYCFYKEGSKLSRPDSHGEMSLITTTQAINEEILSFYYKTSQSEVKTVDAQESLCGGVIVLATGCLTGNDGVKRDFAQSFFLAPQEDGYFVLHDILRYVQADNHDSSGDTDAALSPEHDDSLPPQKQSVCKKKRSLRPKMRRRR